MKKKQKNPLESQVFRSPLTYLYILITMVWTICFINSEFPKFFGDSDSYINWSLKLLGKQYYGSMTRTPVYPIIIKIVKVLLGDNYLYGVITLQIAFSLASVYYLYSTVILIANTKWDTRYVRVIAFVVCLIYALNPSVYQYHIVILTESFAVSFSVIFIYYAIKFLKDSTVKAGLLLLLWTFLCTMLKPAMIIYYVDVVILLLVMYIRNSELRNSLRKIGIGVLFLAVLYIAWMSDVYYTSGVFSMASLGPRHNLVKIIDSGLYKNYYDENIISEIDTIREEANTLSYGLSTPVMRLLGDSDNYKIQNQKVAEFNSYCLKTDPAKYLKYLIFVCKDTLSVDLYSQSYRNVIIRNDAIYFIEGIITPFFRFLNVAQAYVIGLISVFIGLIQFIKNKDYILLCLGGGILSILLSVTLGTYAAWGRCMLYVLPFVYVSIAVLLIDLINSLKSET